MATIMDVGILNHFVPIFVFILVFVIFYAILIKTHILGENKGLAALASFVVAFLFLVTRATTELIQIITPWFVVLIIVAMAFMLIFMFLGVKPEAIAEAVSHEGTVWMIIIILLVLLGLALTKVIGPSIAEITQGEGATGTGFMGSVGSIIFHPKMLGALFILLVASYAIRAVTKAG